MATISVRSDKFAVSEVVTAYPASNWSQSQLPPSGAAVGSSAGSGTVDATGLLTITGLARDTEFFLRGGTSGNYIRARSDKSATPETGGIADTKGITGTVTTPAAGQTLAQIAGLVPGSVYRVQGVIALTGVAETTLNNVRLQTNAASIAGGGVLPSLSGLVIPFLYPRVPCGANGIINLAAQALATTGAIYNVQFTVSQLD